MIKKILSIGLLVTLFGTMSMGCTKKENPENNTGRLRVGVTINPLKEFTEAIGGDKVEVFSIIPPGSEPHDFDPKPKDLEEASKSDVFIYNGVGMEEWIDSVLNVISNEGTTVVDSSKGANIISTENDGSHIEETEEEHSEHEEDGHNHGSEDPHLWLSLKEATKQAENIKNALVEKDSENKDFYQSNYENLKNQFDNLYNEYKVKFENIKDRNFVTGHAAFGYLCRDFGLTQKSIADIYGEGELTPKKLENLVNYCKDNGVKVIFSESTASSKESETLARESGAKVEKIYSLESKEDDMTYLDGMKYNLDKILEYLN